MVKKRASFIFNHPRPLFLVSVPRIMPFEPPASANCMTVIFNNDIAGNPTSAMN